MEVGSVRLRIAIDIAILCTHCLHTIGVCTLSQLDAGRLVASELFKAVHLVFQSVAVEFFPVVALHDNLVVHLHAIITIIVGIAYVQNHAGRVLAEILVDILFARLVDDRVACEFFALISSLILHGRRRDEVDDSSAVVGLGHYKPTSLVGCHHLDDCTGTILQSTLVVDDIERNLVCSALVKTESMALLCGTLYLLAVHSPFEAYVGILLVDGELKLRKDCHLLAYSQVVLVFNFLEVPVAALNLVHISIVVVVVVADTTHRTSHSGQEASI